MCRIDFLSRVVLELGNDAGEMRPHGKIRGKTSMRANQERGLHEGILITTVSHITRTYYAANIDDIYERMQ